MSASDLIAHLLRRLRQVQDNLGCGPPAADGETRFADAVDSMGLVEFLALLADDCAVPSMILEQAAGRRFGTVAELAATLEAAGLRPRASVAGIPATPVPPRTPAWLAATAVRLPVVRQATADLDAVLQRPAGWLAAHAGIHERCVWAGDNALRAVAHAAREALDQAGIPLSGVGALLVTSEAPPLPVGLAAALHHELNLSPRAVALEVGGACTGLLAALWTAWRLLPEAGAVLVAAVEAPSLWLVPCPGSAGEAAALFGDGAAACVLAAERGGRECRRLLDVRLEADGGGGRFLQVRQEAGRGMELSMDGPALAGRAVRGMAAAVRDLTASHGLAVAELGAVVAHGGNGRMPALLARQLGLASGRVWSETARTGNLGSASLPVAWAAHAADEAWPVVWTAAGAGLTWGAALLGAPVL